MTSTYGDMPMASQMPGKSEQPFSARIVPDDKVKALVTVTNCSAFAFLLSTLQRESPAA